MSTRHLAIAFVGLTLAAFGEAAAGSEFVWVGQDFSIDKCFEHNTVPGRYAVVAVLQATDGRVFTLEDGNYFCRREGRARLATIGTKRVLCRDKACLTVLAETKGTK